MKHCPQCNNTYADDNLSFCLVDGAMLSALGSPDTERTLVSRVTDAPPTIILPPYQPPSQPRTTPPWMYAAIGVMGMAIVALVGLLVVPRLFGEPKENQTTTSQVAQQPTPNSPKAEVREAPNVPVKVPPVPKPTLAETKSLEPAPSSVPVELAGRWSGDWTSNKAYYTAVLVLHDNGGGKFTGEIFWTLQRHTNPQKSYKAGATATEYVQGTFNPATRTLFLSGYRKDDPTDIVVLDKYSLTLAENNLNLNGRSKSNGRFNLSR